MYSSCFSGSSSGHMSPSVFMQCLEELTGNWASELKSLVNLYNQTPEEE